MKKNNERVEVGKMTKKNIKIAKVANMQSLMDASPNLWYHKEKDKNGEEVYRGSVVFAITEIKSKKYGKAYLDKPTTKLVMRAIIDQTFSSIFGDTGLANYGGTKKSEKGCRSRVLTIKMGKNKKNEDQYIFTIKEGPGKLTSTGGIAPNGPAETTATTYVHYQEAMKFAHEIYDYIRDVELMAQQEGKPLVTITHKRDNEGQYKEGANEEKVHFNNKTVEQLSNPELTKWYHELINIPGEKKRFDLIVEEVTKRKK